MGLDTRTLIFMIAILAAMQAVAMLYVWRVHWRQRPLAWWSFGATALALGTGFLVPRDIWPDFITITLANLLVLLGIWMLYIGFQLSLDRTPPWGPSVLTLVAGYSGFLYWAYVTPSITERVLLVTIIIAGYSLSIAWELALAPPSPLTRTRRVLAVITLIHGMFALARGITAALGSDVTGLFDPSLVQTAYFVESLIAQTLLNFGCLLLTSESLQASLEKAAHLDHLTGLLNRPAFLHEAERVWARVRRHPSPVSVIMLDLDLFKQINDRFGLQVGDTVLANVAEVLQTSLRLEDIRCRYGGEEFCAILPDTDLPAALQSAERLRQTMAETIVVQSQSAITCTVSVGVANLVPGDTVADTIRAAEEAMLQAKRGGRNLSMVADRR